MLAKLQKAQAKGPEALSAALDNCNKTLGVQNRDKTTPSMTTAAQLKFVEDGGAEFCMELIQKNADAARAWEVLWYASRPAKTQARLFGVPGLVQAAMQEMQQGPAAVAATYMLSNLAYGATGVALAKHPGLLQAAVRALEGPTAQAALVLLYNLATLEANKMALAQTPGLFGAVDQVVIGGDASGRGQYILKQLQQLRILSMVAVPLVSTDGAPASETMSPHQAQMMMMQQQMAQQQMMFQQQMAMQQAQLQVKVQGQKQAQADTSCLTQLLGCLVCIDCVRCCCCC